MAPPSIPASTPLITPVHRLPVNPLRRSILLPIFVKSTIWRSTITASRNVHAFPKWKRIDAPRQLTRAICKEYHIWRQNPKANGGAIDGVFRCGHNNALQDLKILSIICDEAVELGFLEINPVHKLASRVSGYKSHNINWLCSDQSSAL